MSGASIAAQVAAALNEVAADVGDGSFSVTLKRTTRGANPWGATAPSDETFELPAMVSRYPQDMIDGTLIKQDDRMVMMAATGEKPATTDRLVVGGIEYAILMVDELAPSGVPLYYKVQARK